MAAHLVLAASAAWTSLALVPSHAGIDVLKVAEMLVATGRMQGERPVDLVNATGRASWPQVQQVIDPRPAMR